MRRSEHFDRTLGLCRPSRFRFGTILETNIGREPTMNGFG